MVYTPPRPRPDPGPLLRYADGTPVPVEEFLIVWYSLTGQYLHVDRHHTDNTHHHKEAA
jgi:hypothetical protein